MTPLEQLKSVLCDPNGKCCISGSDADRAAVDFALSDLAVLTQPSAVVQEPVYHLRQYGDVTQKEMDEYIATGSIAKVEPTAQTVVLEIVAWRREWAGDVSDEGNWMFVSCEGDKDDLPWEALVLLSDVQALPVEPTTQPETLARKFHEAYERLAPSFGYVTKPETRYFDAQSNNGKLMIAVCKELASPPPVAKVEPTAQLGQRHA